MTFQLGNRFGEFNKGRKRGPHSKEWRKKMSERFSGNKNPFFGKKLSEEQKRKLWEANLGNKNVLGKHWKIADTSKMSLAKKGKMPKNLEMLKKLPRTEEWKSKQSLANSGTNNYAWIADREIARNRRGVRSRNNTDYLLWVKEVKKRDGWKCKINNSDCKGDVVAHHILGWASYPELRYKINNGITLCRAHHPLKRAEEKRLAPVFQELVSVST